MSQESNKEPLGCVAWPRENRGSLYEKEPEKTDASKLAPIFLRFLFQAAAQPRGAALRGLPLGYCVRLAAAVLLRQNERGIALRRGDAV